MASRHLVVVAAGALAVAACGDSGGGGGGASQTCTPGLSATITITSTGLNPVNACVQPGGQVTFTNADTAAHHDIEFDTAGCPTVGDIAPSGHVTATFTTQQNCSFHDGANASNAAFRGTVAVTAVMVSGGGY